MSQSPTKRPGKIATNLRPQEETESVDISAISPSKRPVDSSSKDQRSATGVQGRRTDGSFRIPRNEDGTQQQPARSRTIRSRGAGGAAKINSMRKQSTLVARNQQISQSPIKQPLSGLKKNYNEDDPRDGAVTKDASFRGLQIQKQNSTISSQGILSGSPEKSNALSVPDISRLKNMKPGEWNNIPLPIVEGFQVLISEAMVLHNNLMQEQNYVNKLNAKQKHAIENQKQENLSAINQGKIEVLEEVKKMKDELQREVKKVQDTARREMHALEYKLQKMIDDKDKVLESKLTDLFEVQIYRSKTEVKSEAFKKIEELRQDITKAMNIPNEVDISLADDEAARIAKRERLLSSWLTKKFSASTETMNKNIEDIEDLTHKLQRVDFNARDKATQQDQLITKLTKQLEITSKKLEIVTDQEEMGRLRFEDTTSRFDNLIKELGQSQVIQEQNFLRTGTTFEKNIKKLKKKVNFVEDQIEEEMGIVIENSDPTHESELSEDSKMRREKRKQAQSRRDASSEAASNMRMTIGGRIEKIEKFMDMHLHWNDKQLLVELERIFNRGRGTSLRSPNSKKGGDSKGASIENNFKIQMNESLTSSKLDKAKQEQKRKDRKKREEEEAKLQKRKKYMAEHKELDQDAGELNALIAKEQEAARRRMERMKKNPVTVETLEKFSNLDVGKTDRVKHSQKVDLNQEKYSDFLDNQLTENDRRSSNDMSPSPDRVDEEDGESKTETRKNTPSQIVSARKDSPKKKPASKGRKMSPEVRGKDKNQYNFKDPQTNRFVTTYKGSSHLQNYSPRRQMSKLPSPMRQEDLKPLQLDGDIRDFLNYTKKTKLNTLLNRESVCKTAQGVYRNSLIDSSLKEESALLSEYENMSEFAKIQKYQRESLTGQEGDVKPFQGIYNNGKRVLFQGTGQTVLHHDKIPPADREHAQVKPSTGLSNMRIQSHLVGQDSILTEKNYMKDSTNTHRSNSSNAQHGGSLRSRLSRMDKANQQTTVKILVGQNRSIENATGSLLPQMRPIPGSSQGHYQQAPLHLKNLRTIQGGMNGNGAHFGHPSSMSNRFANHSRMTGRDNFETTNHRASINQSRESTIRNHNASRDSQGARDMSNSIERSKPSYGPETKRKGATSNQSRARKREIFNSTAPNLSKALTISKPEGSRNRQVAEIISNQASGAKIHPRSTSSQVVSGHVRQVNLNQVQTLNQDIDYIELEGRAALNSLPNTSQQASRSIPPAIAVNFETVPLMDRA